MFDQPIIERKNTSPLATSLLVLSAVCLLAATIFVGAQAKSLRYGVEDPTASAEKWQMSEWRKIEREVQEIVSIEE